MLAKNQKKILKIIQLSPFIIVGFLSIIITYFLFQNKNIHYKNEIKKITADFVKRNKNLVKSEVSRVYEYILYEKKNSERTLRRTIQEKVNEAHTTMFYIYEKYKETETKEQIITRIKDALRNYRFNHNRGYFYIYEKTGKNIMLPPQVKLEGKNFWNHQDAKGTYIIQEMSTLLEEDDEAFIEWFWYKPNDNTKQRKKIGIVKEFKPYNLFIGTGEYVDDFENELKEKILKYINTIKYSKNGYIFITNYEGIYLSHVRKSYIGLNRINLEDPNGFMITKEIIKTSKEGSGFIKYIGTVKPITNKPAEKTTYIKGFNDWNWAIGSGYYLDELDRELESKKISINEQNKESLINLILISFILTGIFLFISAYISRILKKHFLIYEKKVLSHIKENRQKDALLAQQSKMATMGEMLQNIAHQWRQPLNTITTISSGIKLKKEYGVLDEGDINKSMDDIVNSSNYLSQTIDDFRDFFNPQKIVKNFFLISTLEKSFKLLEAQFSHKNIQIIKNIDDLSIVGLENELIQAIINILNNARDELLKQQLDNKLIFINVKKKKKDEILITIKDNAGGIKEENKRKVFDAYFTTKEGKKGTGIGLYMTKEIIENHMQGNIHIVNTQYEYKGESHKGALFTIVLPSSMKQKEDS